MKRPAPLPEPLNSRGFSTRDGIQAGLSRERMRGRDLRKPFRGVHVRAGTELTHTARCEALLQRVPPTAFLCLASAARIMAIPLPNRLEISDSVDIGVHAPDSPPEGRGIRGHMFDLDETDIILWNGLPVTSPEVTWCSLGSKLSFGDLVAAGDFLIHRRAPLSTVQLLRARVEQWTGKRGVRNLRRALELLNERSESPMESRLRVILLEAGFAGLAVNYPIHTSSGHDYRADLAFPARKLIVEYQSAFHETPESFRADMTRVSRLEADDWKVMQVNKDDVRNPVELTARIRTTLRARPYF